MSNDALEQIANALNRQAAAMEASNALAERLTTAQEQIAEQHGRMTVVQESAVNRSVDPPKDTQDDVWMNLFRFASEYEFQLTHTPMRDPRASQKLQAIAAWFIERIAP